MGDTVSPSTWDGSKLTQGPFWQTLEEDLPKTDKHLDFFLRNRALFNSKSQMVVTSPEHFVIIENGLDALNVH